jgi:hypothetical protein
MPGSKYSDSEQRGALALFVLASAKPKPYARLQQAHPEVIVPYATVKGWAYSTKRDLHQQVKSELSSTVYGAIEDKSLGMADSAIELWARASQELSERLSDEQIKAMKVPDLVKVMHEMAVSYDISLGKAMAIGGRPTQITRLDFPDLQRALMERHGIKLSIEGEAVEEPIHELEESNA